MNVTEIVQVALGATVAQVLAGAKAAASGPDTVTPETTRLALPVLVSVTTEAVDVVFSASLANVRLDGVRLTAGDVTPVPDRPTRVGDPVTLDAMLRLAVLAPAVVGVNVTEIVQVALGATVAQVVDLAKAAASGPDTVMPVIDRLALPVVVTVKFEAALVVLTDCPAKVPLVGETEIPGVPTAV